MDPTEVAERAGNSVELLLSRYAKCLDGRQDVANRRIAEFLGEDDGRAELLKALTSIMRGKLCLRRATPSLLPSELLDQGFG